MSYDDLLIDAEKIGLSIDEKYHFHSDIKGLYLDGNVALSDSLKTDTEKVCILSEELGHHHTTIGNILDQSDSNNRKQELRARLWAYNKMIGLQGIVNAYNRGCMNRVDMADYLHVTEEFLQEALDCYKGKYGQYASIDNYIIFFDPLGILELYG